MRSVMTLNRFRYLYVAYIVYASLKTMVVAPQLLVTHAAGHGTLLGTHLYALALIEIMAAVGLLLPRLAPASTMLLLAVYAVAALIDLALGEAPVHLLLYAAIALLLLPGDSGGRGDSVGS